MHRSGADLRATPRAPVAIELMLARKAGRPVTARPVDLSAHGARVRCDRPLRVDEELHFDADLPAGGPHVDGTARVLRQDRHDTYALRFETLCDGATDEFQALVEARAVSGA